MTIEERETETDRQKEGETQRGKDRERLIDSKQRTFDSQVTRKD